MIENIAQQRLKYQIEIVDATTFVNVKATIYYDSRHTFLMLRSKNKTYLRLNHDYQLFEKFNRKISSQRCDSFIVKKRIDRLTYELSLSVNWKIHLVIFVAQLKLVLTNDSYHRSRSEHSDFIDIKSDTSQWKFYEIELIIDKRTRNYNNKKVTQYLLRWLDYDSKHDVWRSITKLKNCMNLIEKYEARVRND